MLTIVPAASASDSEKDFTANAPVLAMTYQKEPAPAAAPQSGAKNGAAKPAEPAAKAPPEAGAAKPAPAPTPARGANELSDFGFREVGDFFNVREANSDMAKGEWDFSFQFNYTTQSGESDTESIEPSVSYGITDDMYVELAVLDLILGDGGDQGNGDLQLKLFNQFVHETDAIPAVAVWGEVRIPSGQGSRGVDANTYLNLTKTLAPRVRAHLQGFIETANGGRNEEQDYGRRPFQWGFGPGFDYQFDEKTIGVLNYTNTVGDQYGDRNSNVVEFGVAREIVPGQHILVAADIGVDGAESTENFKLKIEYSIGIK